MSLKKPVNLSHETKSGFPFNPNKAGLFESSFFWGESNLTLRFKFQQELV